MFKVKLATAICTVALALTGFAASAEQYQTSQYGRPGYGGGHGGGHGGGYGRPGYPGRPGPGPGYRMSWQYAGQISGPNHGSPASWHRGVDYCGTEYPRDCYYSGQRCYVNNGYWWDNANQCNWFNYYECR